MVNPVPTHPQITTPYGQEGSIWQCGFHDGADFGSGGVDGDDIVACVGGTVIDKSFGSAFGTHVVIDHDHLDDGSPGYWGLYAHMNSKIAYPGQRVEAGQTLGYVGSTGNSSGPHLHLGVYMQPYWSSGGGIDPQRWIDNDGIDGGSPYPEPSSGTVHLSRLVFGQQDSDSVWYLQDCLNRHSIPGGQRLPTTGNYLIETDEEVRLDQRHHLPPEDPAGASYVGAEQAEHIFDGSDLIVVDDR